MDKLTISGLKFKTLIGTLDWEKLSPQHIYLDLTLATDAKKAALNDDIQDALDYTLIVEHLNHYIETHHFSLIETLAENIAHELLTHFNTTWLQLTLHKPGALLQAKDITLTIERHK